MNEDNKTEDIIYKEVIGGVTIILLVYQALIEYIQCYNSKSWTEYLGFTNFCDMFQLSSTLYILIANMGQDENNDKSNERLVATFAIFVLWIKIFDWLRLFERTSFYTLLLY